MDARSQAGAASVEHAGLALLIALLLLAGITAFAAGPPLGEGRELGSAIARKLRCAPRLPGPCWRDPVTSAYGRSLAGAVRALAPAPAAATGASGDGLLPVDFRRCRSVSCALPGPRSPRLTASNRLTTAFTSVTREAGGVSVDYWLYRPTLGWERIRRGTNSNQVQALARTPLLETDVPRLVPLETLAGRNHIEFAAGEEPPWRWKVASVYDD
jgi:hypothetical protein